MICGKQTECNGIVQATNVVNVYEYMSKVSLWLTSSS